MKRFNYYIILMLNDFRNLIMITMI